MLLNKKSHLRTGATHTHTVTEGDRIKQVDVKEHKYLANTKEEFLLVYTQLLSVIYEKLSHPGIRVFSYMLQNYKCGTPFSITKGLKEQMAEIMSKGNKPISGGTISNALTELVEKKLLFSNAKGIYNLNPRYAFKGSTKDRNAMLKVTLELQCKDC